MKNVIWIGTESEIEEVGGKALNLSRMVENHIPVPPAFFVTTTAYTRFIEQNGLDDTIQALYDSDQQKSERIVDAIRKASIPSDVEESIIGAYELLGSDDTTSDSIMQDVSVDVAVRSSATAEDLPGASFAGQQASFLNVHGTQKVLHSVKECWASLFTERAIAYRKNQGITSAKMCVVVQKMVHSERSGVMFTQDPTSGTEQMLIQAVKGLGEAIVSGEQTPDSYLYREDKVIIQDTPTGTQLLDDREVKELARIAKKIKRIYGVDQDIEWAWDKELYIVQTRNVTAKQTEHAREIEGEILLHGNIASRGVASGPVRIIRSMEDVRSVEQGDVMVTEMTMPDMVPGMMKCAAIITERGGATCHAAIVSRELGIPCLVGTTNALGLQEGQIVTVDAENGVVTKGAHAQSVTTHKHTSKVPVYGIIDIPETAQKCADAGLDGVGLVRLELIIAAAGKHPLWYKNRGQMFQYSQLLESKLRIICEAFPDHHIFVRSSDLRSDEYTNLEGAPQWNEDNPMLGLHAVRFAQKYPEIFRAECQAIARLQKEYPKLALMVPFVVNRAEVEWSKSVYREYSEAWFGCMIETPAACLNIGDIKDLVDFISFGTNDLTQLTLGVDRNNDTVQYLFNECDPSVLYLIDKVIDSGVYTSICGNAATNETMLQHIIGRINSISIPYGAVNEVEQVLQRFTPNTSTGTRDDHAS